MEKLNNTVTLSVIVPIYKVEKYINECISSLVNQSLKNIEIILVDDGSPDNCPAICDEYANRYNNVKVIHKKNGGVVSARKAGFRCCQGEYVTFVDGDDWVENDYYEKAFFAINSYQPDIISVNCHFIKEDGKKADMFCKDSYTGMYERKMLEKDVFPKILSRPPFFSFGVIPSLWSKIIRRDILIDFMPNEPEEIKMGDDLAITLLCLLKAESVYFSDVCGYYYRQNPSSITHTFDSTAPMRVDSLLNYLRETTETYDGYNIKKQISEYAMHILQVTVTLLINGSKNMYGDLKLMKPLWKNISVKEGLKGKMPLKVKLLLLATKSNRVLLLKIVKRRWARKENSVKA